MPENTVKMKDLDITKQRDILCAIFEACAELWGEECMPGAGIGDNRLFNMYDIAQFVDYELITAHNFRHNARRG